MALSIEEVTSTSPDALINEAISQDSVQAVFALAPHLAMLSDGECEDHKAQLKDHFKRRLSTAKLDKAIKDARKQAKRAQVHRRSNDRPVVVIGGQLRDVKRTALNTLAKYNQPPKIFVQNGKLVTVHVDETGLPSIAEVTEHRLRTFMSESADYVSIKETADDVVHIPVTPPLDVTRSILSGTDPSDYPFPPLKGVTEMPIVRTDEGTICQTPGYDAATQYVYVPGALKVRDIPKKPTKAQVLAAVDLLKFWIADFPFVDEASRTAIIAMAITVVVRLVIRGQVPMCLLDAPKQGTGKTLLAWIIGILATGEIADPLPPTQDEDEMRKRVLTCLLQSPAVILIDNINFVLESMSLNLTLTSPFYKDRLLTTNTNVRAANRAIWFATGNNLRVGDDCQRRCINCRLDAKTELPNLRDSEQFHIPGGTDALKAWTQEHRGELIEAILTLYAHWIAAGKPRDPKIRALGNFEDWTKDIAGILYAVNQVTPEQPSFPDFLANLQKEGASDNDITKEWAAFFEAIHKEYGDKPFTLQALAKEMLVDGDESLNTMLPAQLSTKSYTAFRRSDGIDRDFVIHMSHLFRSRKDQRYNSYVLKQMGKDRTNKALWAIVYEQPETPPQVPPAAPTPPQEDAQQTTSLSAGVQGLINSARKRGVGLRWDEEQGVIIVSNVDSDLRERYANVIDKLNSEDWQQLAQYVRSSPIMAREVAS